MEKNTTDNKPDILTYVPAIYQKQTAEAEGPCRALMAIFESTFAGIEAIVDNVPSYFDVETAPSGLDEKEEDFLTWLASWVALTFDKQWWPAEKTDESDQQAKIKDRKKRYLIKNAAFLHQHRGTVSGLQYILGAFYDVDVHIREWAWPQGMEIGKVSSIGLDTFIMDKPDLLQSFTMIWRPSESDQREAESSAPWIETKFMGEASEKGCLTGIWNPTEYISQNGFIRKIQKIRYVLDLARPAHTSCYLGLETPERQPEEVPSLSRMVIGVQSTIGICFIDQEGKNGI